MKTLKELEAGIAAIFRGTWTRRAGQVVPEPADVGLANDGVDLDVVMLYADLIDSTGLVTGSVDTVAAEVYKAFLFAASEIIRNNGGAITAFDGDRVLAVFIGDTKNSAAAKAALQINYVVLNQLKDLLKAVYTTTSIEIKHVVGIDCGKVLVARTGVWGANDLVWVGKAANYAAKMCAIRPRVYATYITESVFNNLHKSSKYAGDGVTLMWDKLMWNEKGITIYGSTYWWQPA